MEDKMFDLMEKMYAEMTEQFEKVNKKLDEKADKEEVHEKLNTMSHQLINLGNTLLPKTQVALEGYQAVYEKLQEHDKRFDELSQRLKIRT